LQSVAFSMDGRRIVTSSVDRTAKIWDANSGKELLSFKKHTNMLNFAVFSPDGQRILSGSDDGTTRVWDPKTGKGLLTLPTKSQAAAFSPDGYRIVTGLGAAVVWDASSGEKLLTFEGHHYIRSVAFSPDGKRIAFCGNDTKATVWDADPLTLNG